jgi:hypothetical protein
MIHLPRPQVAARPGGQTTRARRPELYRLPSGFSSRTQLPPLLAAHQHPSTTSTRQSRLQTTMVRIDSLFLVSLISFLNQWWTDHKKISDELMNSSIDKYMNSNYSTDTCWTDTLWSYTYCWPYNFFSISVGKLCVGKLLYMLLPLCGKLLYKLNWYMVLPLYFL